MTLLPRKMPKSAPYTPIIALTSQMSLLQVTAMPKSAVICHAIAKKCSLNTIIDPEFLQKIIHISEQIGHQPILTKSATLTEQTSRPGLRDGAARFSGKW